MLIRPAVHTDKDALWHILEPVIRAGETNALLHTMSRADAIGYWCASGHDVFVAEVESAVLGTSFIRANHSGPGSHVANAGYMTAPEARGRGIARCLCEHSLVAARDRGFRAMQFNFVVSTNEAAIHLWTDCGFETVGRSPRAFLHPVHGYVDALIMHRFL